MTPPLAPSPRPPPLPQSAHRPVRFAAAKAFTRTRLFALLAATFLFIDMMALSGDRLPFRNQTLFNSILTFTSGMHYRFLRAMAFDTPEGLRIVPFYSQDWEDLKLNYPPAPPTGWKYIAYIQGFPSDIGTGLAAPWIRTTNFPISMHSDGGPDLTIEEENRILTALIVHLESHIHESAGAELRYIALLKAAQTSTSWISTPQLIHEIVFITLALLAIRAIFISMTATSRTEQRRRKGQCLHCGYDLANLLADACPECGTRKGNTAPPTSTT